MIRKISKSIGYCLCALIILSAGYATAVYFLKRSMIDLDDEKIKYFLKDYNNVSRVINDLSAFPTEMEFTDNHMQIKFNGDRILESGSGNYKFEEIKNSTYKSAIFSLSFIRNYLKTNKLDKKKIGYVDKCVASIISYSDDLYNNDDYILHDHPVSERLETLLLYTSYKLKNNYQVSQAELNHIKHLIRLLEDNYYFTYYMNHGLIQVKALLRTGVLFENKQIIEKAKQFLDDTYEIYIGFDGAILESASQYQLYIHGLYVEFNRLLKSKGDYSFDSRVTMQKNTLSSLVTGNGFLQGFGDSYNKYTDIFSNRSDNTVFSFSNGVSGLNFKELNFNLLFVSGDNKPNVHKLPEDLALYIFYDGPFFINTGTYSYNNKDKYRKYFLKTASQNGVKFYDNEVSSSSIRLNHFSDTSYNFLGIANSKDTIIRDVTVDIKNACIHIKDSSRANIYSQFILHPNVSIKKRNKNTIELHNTKKTILLEIVQDWDIIETNISTSLFNITKAQMIRIKGGGDIKLSFVEGFPQVENVNIKTLKEKNVINKRFAKVKELKTKYPNAFNIRKINVSYLVGAFGIFFLFLIMFFLPQKYSKYALLLVIILQIINILHEGGLLVNYFYNIISVL